MSTAAGLLNRLVHTFKTVLSYAMTELEVVDRNVMMRFRHEVRSGIGRPITRSLHRPLARSILQGGRKACRHMGLG